MKQNCWQFKDCGREPGGRYSNDGICPASVENRLHGSHGGQNAGRACWVVPKTPCSENSQNFELKYRECSRCNFYKKVRYEEKRNFELSLHLLQRLAFPDSPDSPPMS
ncbi:MAG: hypothetical protein Q8J64_02870 [Thermodesulfovibrionales bacterium]|nr:hypothetical protein [Thermodesulfovibrionales bacterium]